MGGRRVVSPAQIGIGRLDNGGGGEMARGLEKYPATNMKIKNWETRETLRGKENKLVALTFLLNKNSPGRQIVMYFRERQTWLSKIIQER